MSSPSPEATIATERLQALRAENYRRTRWAAINAARQLDPPLTWSEIGDALGVLPSAASRLYRTDKPE